MADAQTLKDAYKNLMDAVQSGDAERFAQNLTDDYAWHGNNGQDLDKAGLTQMVGGYKTAFPDMTFNIINMMVEGDMLSCVWSVSGTHTGPMGDIPPTGRPIDMRGHVLCRFEGTKMAEEWELFDEALMMRQLGIGE